MGNGDLNVEHPKNGTEQAVDRMEKPVDLLTHLPSLGEAAQVSTAISLKRIADALEQQNKLALGLWSTLDPDAPF